MNKIHTRIPLIYTVFMLTLICTFLFSPGVHAEEAAIIAHVKGNVEYSSGQGDWLPAESGTILQWGAEIRAGRNGRATVILSDERTIDIHEQTLLVLDKKELDSSKGIGKFIKGLFQIVKNKFSDTEYTNAALGEVGVVRGEPSEEELEDYPLSGNEQKELNDKIDSLSAWGDAGNMSDSGAASGPGTQLLLGMLFEEYGQYKQAEEAYRKALENQGPEETTAAALLIDLYVKNDKLMAAREIKSLYEDSN